jgi:hypothetical protein
MGAALPAGRGLAAVLGVHPRPPIGTASTFGAIPTPAGYHASSMPMQSSPLAASVEPLTGGPTGCRIGFHLSPGGHAPAGACDIPTPTGP